MPTYDYRCQRTGEMFELWQSFVDDAITTCPQIHDGNDDECGAPVKKVFSKVGISFKGGGFYRNDHGANASASKSESRRSDNGSDSGSSSSKASSSNDSGSTSSTSTSSTKSDAPTSSSSSGSSRSSD